MRVLIQKSHYASYRPNGWSGAPGEADYILELCGYIDAITRNTPIIVFWTDGDYGGITGDSDLYFSNRHPEFRDNYDAFIALHYDADVYRNVAGDHLSGWFWDRALASLTGPRDDALGQIWQRRYSLMSGVPSFHPERRNANTRDYYAFRATSINTPGIIIELGIGAPNAPDYRWLRDNIMNIAQTVKATLYEYGGIADTVPAPQPAPLPQLPALGVPVLGTSSLRYLTLVNGLTAANKEAALEIVSLYQTLAPSVGIRAEIALAQALHETGFFKFPGRAQPDWHNPCGLGVGANPIPNRPNSADCRFPTWEEGIRAHLGHLIQYFDPTPDHRGGFCDKDPRHGTHRNLPNDLVSLVGTWAVPGIKTLPDGSTTTYADAIAKLIP